MPAMSMKRASSSSTEPRMNLSASILAGRPFWRAVFVDDAEGADDMAAELTLSPSAVERRCEYGIFSDRPPATPFNCDSGIPRHRNSTWRVRGIPQRKIHNDILTQKCFGRPALHSALLR